MGWFGCFFRHDWAPWNEPQRWDGTRHIYRDGSLVESQPWTEMRQRHLCRRCGWAEERTVYSK